MPQHPQYMDPDTGKPVYFDPDTGKPVRAGTSVNVATNTPRIGPPKTDWANIMSGGLKKPAGWVANEIRGIASEAYRNPEGFIESVAPAAGATFGAALGGPPGAVVGAGLGHLFGKMNRGASNVSTGKNVAAGMPTTAVGAAADTVGSMALNAGPDVALAPTLKLLRRGGRSLISKAASPNLSSVNNMSEMGIRGELPQDVRNQIAETLYQETKKAHEWSPVSDDMARRLMDRTKATGARNTEIVEGMRDAGQTLPMGPVYGEAGGFALKGTRAGYTPAAEQAAVRARLRELIHAPESRLTVPFEKHGLATKPTETLAHEVTTVPNLKASTVEPKFKTVPGESSFEGIETVPTVERSRIPHPSADPMDVLDAQRKLGGELRSSYGLDPTQTAAQKVDKALYHSGSESLKNLDVTGELRSGMKLEHEQLNALDALINRSYLQSNQKPINLYTLLGILGTNPSAIALGVGNYPKVMAGVGRNMMSGADRFLPATEAVSNAYRAAMLGLMNQPQR